MRRDFTYVDDIVAGILAVADGPPSGENGAPHMVYNIGNHQSEPLLRFIELLEQALGRKAELDLQPMQPGDVKETFADISAIKQDFGYAPTTSIDKGIPQFIRRHCCSQFLTPGPVAAFRAGNCRRPTGPVHYP